MQPVNKKHTRSKSSVIKPYIVDSAEHIKAHPTAKPLHLNIEQVLKSQSNINVTEEIQLKSDFLELVEDEHQAYTARKNHLLKNDRRKQQRSRSATRYQPKKTNTLVFSKNILGLKKKNPSKLINCSVTGACLLTERAFKTGSIIHLQMGFHNAEQSFNCTAKVIHTNKPQSAEKAHMLGIKFLNVSNEYKDFIIKEALRQKLR